MFFINKIFKKKKKKTVCTFYMKLVASIMIKQESLIRLLGLEKL